MTLPTVKEYNRISKYKDLDIETEKMYYLTTSDVPVIVRSLGMINKGTNKRINRISWKLSQYEIENNWTWQNCSFP